METVDIWLWNLWRSTDRLLFFPIGMFVISVCSKSRSALLYVMVRTLWPACKKYKVAVIATVTELFSLFKLQVHKIWSVDSQENHTNCCHKMSDFIAKKAPNSISAGALPQTLLGELIALPQLDLRGLPLRERMGREGREKKGREGKSPTPCWNFTNTAW